MTDNRNGETCRETQWMIFPEVTDVEFLLNVLNYFSKRGIHPDWIVPINFSTQRIYVNEVKAQTYQKYVQNVQFHIKTTQIKENITNIFNLYCFSLHEWQCLQVFWTKEFVLIFGTHFNQRRSKRDTCEVCSFVVWTACLWGDCGLILHWEQLEM